MQGTQTPKENISTKLQRIAELAKRRPSEGLRTLAHHIDIEWLREAYRRTRKDGATGIDGQSAAKYAERLDENLVDLLNRAKVGLYRAPAVRRVQIPKGNGATRPIGIPTFEDKVLQRAVAMVLEAVYEQEFYDFSHGFRPGRSCHGALDELWSSMMKMRGGWVLEVDISSFFDTLDHGHLREILQQRIRDGVIVKLIGKWLKAGVLDGGTVRRTDKGTPQGGVISPLLANIYLHEVLDKWFVQMVKPKLVGEARLVRYADDAVLVFSSENDARRVLKVLPERFAKYGLKLHPEKTRLVKFERPPRRKGCDDGDSSGTGTFDFLGFTHYWGRSRKGALVVKLKTSKKSLRRAISRVSNWCKMHRHDPIKEQHKMLGLKLRGHYNYYGVWCNTRALRNFYWAVRKVWRKWLSRRSQRAGITWERFSKLTAVCRLPTPRLALPCRGPA
jgi:RNA-directed DNA polymerase